VTRFSPLWLGLSLMKPQIGAVFWLHALWQRQWRLLASACLVPLLLTGAYAARAHVSLPAVPVAYAQSIRVQYGDILWGQTEVTSWLRGVWPSVPAVALTLCVAALVFAPLARLRPQLGLSLASLLSLRHLSYDLILLLPWLAVLDGAALWLVAVMLVADPSAGVSLSPIVPGTPVVTSCLWSCRDASVAVPAAAAALVTSTGATSLKVATSSINATFFQLMIFAYFNYNETLF